MMWLLFFFYLIHVAAEAYKHTCKLHTDMDMETLYKKRGEQQRTFKYNKYANIKLEKRGAPIKHFT